MTESPELHPLHLEEGFASLSTLSEGEFRAALTDVLVDADLELAFGRVGRLMAVWLKHPFAESLPYDLNAPGNWAKSQRAWEIRRPITNVVDDDVAARRDLLLIFAVEWGRQINQLAEYNIFLSICKRLRPVVCGESKVIEQADKIAADLRKKGQAISSFSANDVLGATAVTIATSLVQHVSFLSVGMLPLVSGATLLLCCFGHRRACEYLAKFLKSYDPRRDYFAGSARCGSTDTDTGEPCRNPVREHGHKCWIHAPI